MPIAMTVAILFCVAEASSQVPQTTDARTTDTQNPVRLKPILREATAPVRLRPVRGGRPLGPNSAELSTDSEGRVRLKPVIQGEPRREIPGLAPSPLVDDVVPTSTLQLPAMRLTEAERTIDAGRVEEGARLLRQLAREHPHSPEAPRALLLAAGTVQDLTEARRGLRRVVLDYPLSPEARLALERIGEFSFILGDYDETVRAFRAFRKLETDPERLKQVGIRLAMALLRSGRYEESRFEFEALRAKNPELEDSPEILEAEADALLALGRIREAALGFERIESRFPNYGFTVKVLLSRGICAELEGRTRQAAEHYERIEREYPRSLEASLAARRLEDLARPLFP